MKKSNIRYTIIILLVIITLLLIKFLPNLLNKSNYSNLEIYKNNTFINVSEEQRRKIIDYLKKEKFNKKNIASSLDGGTYKISYDNVELYFNDYGSCYYKNNHTEENYNTILSNEFVNYVKNLSD